MHEPYFPNLSACTEFSLTLRAQPPRLVHGTILLVIGLLGTVCVWAALTRVDLIVRVPGRVRPIGSPRKVFNGGRGEVLNANGGGRVAQVHFVVGDEVRLGDVLLRLETGRLDNEVARRKRTVQTGGEELTRLARLDELLSRQFEATRARAQAEIAQAAEELRKLKVRQSADLRLAEVELGLAQDEEGRQQQLAARGSASESDRVRATARLREAWEKLEKARLPVDGTRLKVLEKGLALAEREYELNREDVAIKRAAKLGEVEVAQLELAALEIEREQSVVRVPVDGIVTGGEVKAGDIVETARPVAEIAEQRSFRFEAAVPNEEVGHLRVGLPVKIKLDAYDHQRYGTLNGTVVFIAPDATATDGEQKASYLVRIEVDGEEVGQGELRRRVKLGMSGQAEIVTGREKLLSLLVRQIRQSISL